MKSAAIISNTLKEHAEKVDAPERGIIYSWPEFSNRSITEEILILDTKFSTGYVHHNESVVAGEGTHDLMDFFRTSTANLLDSGRVLIGLLSEPRWLYDTERETLGFDNYSWLPPFLGSAVEPGEYMSNELFINASPDLPFDIHLRNRDSHFNTYFSNVQGAEVVMRYDKSSIEDWSAIALCEIGDETLQAAISIYSWMDQNDDVIHPDGNIILLPRPQNIRVDIQDWFRSLVEIGHIFSPESTGIDQFNRVIGRHTSTPLKQIYQILFRLPNIARLLENRRGDKEPLTIENEYDVQYLLNALLKIFFDDVRPEEYGPSHGGSSPRIDFLLREGSIAIESKITRQNRGNSEIKNELSEDKEHYRSHPDCDILVCFIYDPDFEIENPIGFEKDLSGESEDLITEVIVSSTRRIGN